MEKKAWYIGCSSQQIADRVILVGDPARVSRLQDLLDDVQVFPVNRGLMTITGSYQGTGITVAAFGMGAPIAAIVMHELYTLGARVFLRIGTAIALPPIELGDFIIADKAQRHEGTSNAYAPADYEAIADLDVISASINAIKENGHNYRVGNFASYDGFYRDMFSIEKSTDQRVQKNLHTLSEQGVVAVDMETSALLTVGRVLGCKAGSLCVATVNSLKHQKIDHRDMEVSEQDLFTVALRAVTTTQL
ncbi:nucleoside phosphorylase [Exilibacterium tricleocarpae]|uniref:Uridine phosphorylase n=1 Tax=Exilibacterium tricleocarpae TaxID=2591008 RepID=A0A545TK49_9GAMM|nr:nucleoside phosphorylase [Exilibacterium tricleocarpae]TQV77610.1 nucleoside phosphorylase [Exilibacterium tricleocarpae]